MTRRAVITREELFETATRLASEGKTVSAGMLLDALGGGSYTTIYKYLGEWEAGRTKSMVHVNTEQPPESVLGAMSNVWRVATHEAAKEVIAAREKAAEEVKAAQQQFTDALDAIRKLESSSELDASQIETLTARVAELEKSVSSLGNENAALKATADQLKHQVKAQQAEIERFHTDIENEKKSHQSQLERLTADHQKLEERANAQIEQMRQQLGQEHAKHEETIADRKLIAAKLDQSTQQNKALETARDQALKEREAAVKAASELTGQINILKEQNTDLLLRVADKKPK